MGDVAMLIQVLYAVARANEQHEFILLTQPFLTELLLDAPDNVEAMAIDIRREEHSFLGLVRYAQRLVAVRAGEILADGAPSAVFTRELVRDLYDVESRVSDIEIAGRCTKLCLPERVAKEAAVQ